MQHIWFEAALLADGWVRGVRLAVGEDGRIAALVCGVEAQADDQRGGIALPGLANVHSHAFQRGMAGLAEYRGSDNDDFWSWRALMYRFLDRLNPDDIEAIAALAYAEMLETGFTRVGEFHYLHHAPDGSGYADPAELAARIAAAAETTGIGLTLLPVFYRYAGFDRRPPEHGHIRFVTDCDGFARLFERSRAAIAGLPDANIGIAPHSLRAVDTGDLAEILSLVPGGPVHIHAAEQTGEVEQCVAALGARPVEWLLDHAGVDARWCLIHATHLDPAETARLARSGAVAGLCPITEANLGDGIFPAPAFLASGGRFAIGTDSNIVIDPARELQTMEYAQRLVLRKRNLLASNTEPSTGSRLFGGALSGGAQALGQSSAGLAIGAPADIVGLDPDALAMVGRGPEMALDSWIFAGGHDVVCDVWRRGRHLVVGGRHIAREEIAARYQRTMIKLLSD
ncbi:formimidoylglutamate deiminase [Novosphingobium sp. Chol11]|uniref:formimidoylglutamate deiminase n=1 Tax=Novosphingobium sp. Chol11 TaxID=1385763 RepID=UPI0025DB2EFC|nr:formimidoylglutamate deiminase [Novosphingobium sp. Chol11]